MNANVTLSYNVTYLDEDRVLLQINDVFQYIWCVAWWSSGIVFAYYSCHPKRALGSFPTGTHKKTKERRAFWKIFYTRIYHT